MLELVGSHEFCFLYFILLFLSWYQFIFAASYVLNSTLAPALGLPLNPQAAAEAEKLLSSSLSKIESFWLKGNAKFLLGSLQPSIADLSLVCEIMQLEVRKSFALQKNSTQHVSFSKECFSQLAYGFYSKHLCFNCMRARAQYRKLKAWG